MRSVYDVLPLRLPAMCWHGKWLRNLETPRRTMWSARPTSKYSSHLIFTFYTNRHTSGLELFHVVFYWKKVLRVAPGNRNRLWNCWIAVERSKMMSISIHIIANQSSYHDDKSTLQCFIHVFCPPLIRNVRSRRRIDSSSIIAHSVNSDLHTWARSLKCYAKNSTYIYMYIYDALDNRYGFSISVQPGIDCTTFQFLFM